MVSAQTEKSDLRYESKPPDVVLEVANRVVALFTDRVDGKPLDNFIILRGLAKKLDCMVVPAMGGGSSYSAVQSGVWKGVIMLDVAQPADQVVRDIAHELTHHVLHLYRLEDEIDRYDTGYLPALDFDRNKFEEFVCHTVAGIVKALPHGLQWNGKLALPRGDGSINVYTRLRVTVPSQSIPAVEWDQLEDS